MNRSPNPQEPDPSADRPDAIRSDARRPDALGSDARRSDCPLCVDDGGEVVVRTANWRVVLVHEPLFPGFTRVIWNDHRREMTDLTPAERDELMHAVYRVEALMIEVLAPDKINLASLGNQVDHVHWHVIPRWRTDSHFPSPIWAAPIAGRPAVQLLAPDRLDAWRSALIDLFASAVHRHDGDIDRRVDE